jgi:hypothetical protein
MPSNSPVPADRPSAEVVRFPGKSERNLKRNRQPLGNQSSLEDREYASSILKEAVTFTACVAAYDGAWTAERTGDGIFAGSDGVVGGTFWDRAKNSVARLTKLVRKADEATVMTVELRSLAATAGFILDRERKQGGLEVSLERPQVDFLIAFASLALLWQKVDFTAIYRIERSRCRGVPGEVA